MKKIDEEKREEALLAISLWRESGLNQGEFCRRENISRSTFQHWRRRYDESYEYKGKKKSRSSKSSFIPVQTVPSCSASVSKSDLEVIYTNGVRIKCPTSISRGDLEKLIGLQVV